MAKDTEIKINEADFNDAIATMNILIQDLCDAYKNIASKNQELAMAWTGSGGDAFVKGAYSIERRFSKKITSLKSRKEELEKAKEAFIKADDASAKEIESETK